MLFHIIKFGGGCLRTAKDVKRIPTVLKVLEGNIVVVSAFYGMTNVLVRAAKELSFDIFLQDFLLPHKAIVKELNLYTLDKFFQEKNDQAQHLLSCMKVEDDVSGRLHSELVAMGEDVAQAIVVAYLLHQTKILQVKAIDARLCIIQQGSGFIDVSIDQVVTRQRIQTLVSLNSPALQIRVVQGFIAGSMGRSPGVASLMRREGSDLTAALFAATLPNAKLTYCKRFPTDGKSLGGNISISKFFKQQEELGTVIVSPEIINVEGLPSCFRVRDFENLKRNLSVATD